MIGSIRRVKFKGKVGFQARIDKPRERNCKRRQISKSFLRKIDAQRFILENFEGDILGVQGGYKCQEQ